MLCNLKGFYKCTVTISERNYVVYRFVANPTVEQSLWKKYITWTGRRQRQLHYGVIYSFGLIIVISFLFLFRKKTIWNKISVYPFSSVYYDDSVRCYRIKIKNAKIELSVSIQKPSILYYMLYIYTRRFVYA